MWQLTLAAPVEDGMMLAPAPRPPRPVVRKYKRRMSVVTKTSREAGRLVNASDGPRYAQSSE